MAGRDYIRKGLFLLIILIPLMAYSNTFTSSFVFDDSSLIERTDLKDLNKFLTPGHLKSNRFVTDLTFALNYKINGFNVTGYHLINLLVHIINAILLYLLINYTFKTPRLRQSKLNARMTALVVSLLFASHPVQTEAVTYIVQRYTSLSTMFYMLSLCFYIKWRLSSEDDSSSQSHSMKWYLCGLASTIVAMKSKEISFTLPVMIIFWEIVFWGRPDGKRLLYLIPFLLTMLIIPLSLINFSKPLFKEIGRASMVTDEISRSEYLLTQFRVMITYLRLILYPANQNADYDYPIYQSLSNLEVLISFIAILGLFTIAIYLVISSRDGVPEKRLAGFGILWFFITISVESSIIPIDDVIFEHRLYLPSAGLFMAIVSGLFITSKRMRIPYPFFRQRELTEVLTVMLIALSLLFAGLTYARNRVWKDDISLWKDVIQKSPDKGRGYFNLALAYHKKGDIGKAMEEYKKAISCWQRKVTLDRDYIFMAKAYNNLGQLYTDMGRLDSAERWYKNAIRIRPDYPLYHYNLGNVYMYKGKFDDAIHEYRRSIDLSPQYLNAYINLAVAYRKKGLLKKSIDTYLEAIKIKPDFAVAHYNLANAYLAAGDKEKAIKHYRIAITLNPMLKRRVR